MKISIDPAIAGRINAAWQQLSPDQQGQMAGAILNANQQAVAVSQTGKAPAVAAAPHTLMLAHSLLTNDSDAVVSNLEAGIVIDVGPDGTIWGTGKYQQLDPGWAEALAVFLETKIFGGIHPFVQTPQTIQIPDSVRIGLAGDWGTGNWRTASNPAPSTDVGQHMGFLNPDLSIHLGDVYYAGTSDEEQHQFINIWPKGTIGSLALNSNHEMYSGAKPYFQAIANPPFQIQQGCSFFALENVGLDSAYYSNPDNLYLDGALFPANMPNAQNDFLLLQAAAAANNGKRVILLTHHNGLDETGATTNALWDQVMNAFPAGTGPAYWYWGHAHAGVIYQNQDPGGRNVACRCCGHAALPWGHATELDNNANVLWYEKRSANDPDIPQRVLNGFAMLSLDGPNIKEVFYDENGGVAGP